MGRRPSPSEPTTFGVLRRIEPADWSSRICRPPAVSPDAGCGRSATSLPGPVVARRQSLRSKPRARVFSGLPIASCRPSSSKVTLSRSRSATTGREFIPPTDLAAPAAGHEHFSPPHRAVGLHPNLPASGLLSGPLRPAVQVARHPGAQHYVGYSDDIDRRIEMHRKEHRSPLLAAALAVGIDFRRVRTWPGTARHFERKLHSRHGSRLCPEPECVSEQRRRRRLQVGLPLSY